MNFKIYLMLCLLHLATAGGRFRRQEGIFTRALRALSFADRTSSSYVPPKTENKTKTSDDDDDDDSSSSSTSSSSSASTSSAASTDTSASTGTSSDSGGSSGSTDSASAPAPAPSSGNNMGGSPSASGPSGNSTSTGGNSTSTGGGNSTSTGGGNSTSPDTTNDSPAIFNSSVAANISMDEEGNMKNSSKTETLLPEEGPQPDSWPWIISFVFLALAAVFLVLTCVKSCNKGGEYEPIPNAVV